MTRAAIYARCSSDRESEASCEDAPEQLEAELARVEARMRRLVDLAADGDLGADVVRASWPSWKRSGRGFGTTSGVPAARGRPRRRWRRRCGTRSGAWPS